MLVDALRIANFTCDQIAELYAQHTAETGQEFTAGAVSRAFSCTRGQPWLVTALARHTTRNMGIDPADAITAAHMGQAKERVIHARGTHLDSLAARLREPRVQRVIEPIIAGADLPPFDPEYDDDVSYCQDLGLLAPGIEAHIANPIYREVIVRLLTAGMQRAIRMEPRAFLLPNGRIDFGRLVADFGSPEGSRRA